MVNHIGITLLLFTFSVSAFAQLAETANKENNQNFKVVGKVVDHYSGQPLEYATISLLNKGDKSLITGGITDEKGIFNIETTATEFNVEIAFLGYSTLNLENQNINGNILDLQKIRIRPISKVLNELTVVAERSQTVFHLDKRVFNVGKDLISAGGSALDVLNNVPSVDVNIEGVVSLRGNSNVQILINGKPSVMTSGNSNTLGTITADMIDRVEVITNPSAKYEAEGTTGIINIVIKKEERKGLNGSVTLNTGIPNNHSIGLSLNNRTEKFNLFGQLGAGQRRFLSNRNGLTIDRGQANPDAFHHDGDGEKNEQFNNIILGVDYHFNPLNVLTLSGHFAYEFEDEYATTSYNLLDNNEQLINSSLRNEETEATNPKWEYELQYKKSFEDEEDRSLTASATGHFFGKEQFSDFTNTNLIGSLTDIEQTTRSDFSTAHYNFQTDYTHPFSEITTLEVGARYEISDVSNDYQVSDLAGSDWIINPNFTNIFDFDQKILGLYATYSYELDKFGIKAGLRVENTQLITNLRSANKKNSQNYTTPFPSIHTSYKLTEHFSVQLGYSRRIHRPRMRDLNPFVRNIRDNRNLSVGNPELLPAYSNSFELTAIRTLGIGDINMAVFHHQTDGTVDYITEVMDSLTIATAQNVGKSNSTGIAFNSKIDASKWLSIMADFYWSYFQRTGVYDDIDFDFDNTGWSGRITAKVKLPAEIDSELRMRYHSKGQELQGSRRDIFYADFGIRKKLFGGRAIVNFSMRDVFNSRRYISEMDQPTFYRYSVRQSSGRRLVLGLSFGFGKGDAMEFSGHKMF